MPAGGIAVENGAVLGKGDLSRGVLGRLPVRVIRAALHIVDRLAIQLEWNTQLDQRLDLAPPRQHTIRRSRDRPQVACTDSRKADTARPVHIDHAPSGEVALERARCLFFDLSPRRIGNGGKLAMQIIHAGCFL